MPSNHAALARFLDRLLSRSPLSNEERNAILGLTSHANQVHANHDVVSPGQTVEHACLVAHGLVARYEQMKDGQRQLTAFHIPGDMCDLHSVPCPTTEWGLLALSTTTVVNVPHNELRALSARYPNLALAFWRDTTADASILAKWVGNLGQRDARQRLAHVICETGLRLEQAGLGSRDAFWFGVTQDNLADALGLTAVHVNRTLQSMRAEKLIRTDSRMIYIDDWKRICDVAGFDPSYLLLEHRKPVPRKPPQNDADQGRLVVG